MPFWAASVTRQPEIRCCRSVLPFGAVTALAASRWIRSAPRPAGSRRAHLPPNLGVCRSHRRARSPRGTRRSNDSQGCRYGALGQGPKSSGHTWRPSGLSRWRYRLPAGAAFGTSMPVARPRLRRGRMVVVSSRVMTRSRAETIAVPRPSSSGPRWFLGGGRWHPEFGFCRLAGSGVAGRPHDRFPPGGVLGCPRSGTGQPSRRVPAPRPA